MSIDVYTSFPLGLEGRIWNVIALAPAHCLSFNFDGQKYSGTSMARTHLEPLKYVRDRSSSS